MMLCSFFVNAQHVVKGMISELDEPLIGVTVVEKDNPSNGTITDFDGTYEVTVTSPTSTLIFSYIGMETQEIPVDTRKEINVQMAPATSYMDEIIVVGYGNQKRSNISGSVATVSAEEISETPVLRVEQALQGRTAGVQIAQNSGSPGAKLKVRIRGTGTVNNSDPLYIVDGIPVEDLDFLNPNDIENVSVLKDAASAAVYGARAANGVVLIKTKSGDNKGGSTISYESYYGMQQASSKLDLLNAREYAVILNESYINAGRAPFVNLEDPSIFNNGTDWQDAIFESAPIQSHQFSINGGGDDFNVGLSANYFAQDGIIGGPKSGFDRKTIRAVFGYQAKEWLHIGTNIGFTNFSRSTVAENSQFVSPVIHALNMDPLTPVYKPDGTYAYSDFVDTDIRNPLNTIENSHNWWTTNRVVGAVFGTVDITENLAFKSTYSVDANFAEQRGFNPTWNLSVDSTDAPTPEINLTNSVWVNDLTWRNWQWENVMTYKGNFGDDHNYTAVGGVAAKYSRFDFNGSSNTNLPSNDPDDAYIGNTIDPIGSQGASQDANENALFSYFGKIDYDFQDKYLAMVAFRADGSSKFGENKRFGYFPAVSLGWKISSEDFFDIPAISLFKLRASWGQNGNDRIGNYGFTSIVRGGQNYTFGEEEVITNGSIATTVSNPELQWETTTQTDIGVDLELFDGRINFIADYFIKNTTEMLYRAPIPAVVGAEAPERNIGEVENRGVELALQYRNRDNAFKYEIGGNVSFIKNEVLFLGGGDPTFSGNTFSHGDVSKTDIGHPIASFYGWETDGIFQTQAEVEAHAFQSEETAPGDIRFKDLDGDGIITIDDRTYIGNPTPNAVFGLNGNIEFKNIDLSVFCQGVSGNDIFNASVRYDKFGGNKPSSILNRWTGEGTSDFEPKVSLLDPNQNVRASDRFIEDGSYFRIKNLQIGYTLPTSLLDKMRFTKFRIYGSVQNLWTFTNYSGFDPEIGSSAEVDGVPQPLDLGIDRGFYPQSRTILGGIQIVF